MFSSLKKIWPRLNKVLLVKFINKIKVFLKQNSMNESRNKMFTAILDSLLEYSKENKNETNIHLEIIDFYYFIYSDFSFNINDHLQRLIADKLALTLASFDDERIINFINALEQMPDLNEKVLMLFYIKCRLVSLQYKSISFISSSVSAAMLLIE